MSSLLLTRSYNAPALRGSVLKQIPLKRIFTSNASERPTNALSTTNIRLLMEQAIESLTHKVAENKMAPLLFSWACNALVLRVLKQVRFEHIFRTFTYESPINVLRPRIYHRCTPTAKLYKIVKGTLAVVGGLGLSFYKLNQSRDIETYTTGIAVGLSVSVVSKTKKMKSTNLCNEALVLIMDILNIFLRIVAMIAKIADTRK